MRSPFDHSVVMLDLQESSTFVICFTDGNDYYYEKDFKLYIYPEWSDYMNQENAFFVKEGENEFKPTEIIHLTVVETAYEGRCFNLTTIASIIYKGWYQYFVLEFEKVFDIYF